MSAYYFFHFLISLNMLSFPVHIFPRPCRLSAPFLTWGGRVVRWSWVNFQCRGVLQRARARLVLGQGPTALAVGAGGDCLNIFTFLCFSPRSPSLWETTRYRLKYCLKWPLHPKQSNLQCGNICSSIRDVRIERKAHKSISVKRLKRDSVAFLCAV